MNRFLVPPELLTGETVRLPTSVSRQLSRVLRIRAGSRIVLFGGDGAEWAAEVVSLNGEQGEARLLNRSVPEVELSGRLHIGLAVLKGEKLDWALQKLTELGVTKISLLQTERTIVSAEAERWPKRLERYSAIIREAVEQSGRVKLPEVASPVPLAEWLDRVEAENPLILSPLATVPLQECVRGVGVCTVAVGPEGGFSAAEIALAESRGARTASLGRRVLRAETAAITAAALAAAVIEGERGRTSS